MLGTTGGVLRVGGGWSWSWVVWPRLGLEPNKIGIKDKIIMLEPCVVVDRLEMVEIGKMKMDSVLFRLVGISFGGEKSYHLVQ